MSSPKLRLASLLIWRIGVPVTMVSGTFGNIMIVLIQRRLTDGSGSGMSVYFLALALSDLVALWCDPIFWFLNSFDIFLYSNWLCKARVFLAYFNAHFSAAILVTMTFQRAASILWPLKANVHCNGKFARSAMSTLFVLFVLLNSHILYGHTVHPSPGNGTAECFFSYVSNDYEMFFDDDYGWVDTFFSSLLPFCLLAAANCVLVWKVSQSLIQAKRRLISEHSFHLRSRQKKSSSMTVTLIAVSIAFVVFTLPSAVYVNYAKQFSHGQDSDEDIAAANELMLSLSFVMLFCNKAVNFYVYCLTGSKYRAEFARMFCQR